MMRRRNLNIPEVQAMHDRLNAQLESDSQENQRYFQPVANVIKRVAQETKNNLPVDLLLGTAFDVLTKTTNKGKWSVGTIPYLAGPARTAVLKSLGRHAVQSIPRNIKRSLYGSMFNTIMDPDESDIPVEQYWSHQKEKIKRGVVKTATLAGQSYLINKASAFVGDKLIPWLMVRKVFPRIPLARARRLIREGVVDALTNLSSESGSPAQTMLSIPTLPWLVRKGFEEVLDTEHQDKVWSATQAQKDAVDDLDYKYRQGKLSAAQYDRKLQEIHHSTPEETIGSLITDAKKDLSEIPQDIIPTAKTIWRLFRTGELH